MSELVARTGRHQQRYEDGYRMIAGCIPFKYRNVEKDCGDASEKTTEILMITSTGGPALVFPKFLAEASLEKIFGHLIVCY